MDNAVLSWAREEFGRAELGDRRRVQRLVGLAASVAKTPAGTVTAVVSKSAEREGAFRFLQNERVVSEEVGRASHAASVDRCREYPWVYVPIDGSSLSFEDRSNSRDIGQVGTWSNGSRGLLVATAMAVSPDGSPIGVCGQRYWAREERANSDRRTYRRVSPEMLRHVDVMRQVHERFQKQTPDVRPWFQLDRGYDAWAIWKLAQEQNCLVTMRASFNRRVRKNRHEKRAYLMNVARRAPVLGTYSLPVPRSGFPDRIARMQVRFRPVTIEMRIARKRLLYVNLNLVVAKEMRTKDPVHWVLLTTAPVSSFADAMAVINGYTTRWRIEEFHRAWKRGVCNVEDTQLRSREGIIKWATILAAVAARSTRLTYLAREKPDAPATEELAREEIDAAIALRMPKGFRPGAHPTLGEVVRWIADLGGYTGKSSGGPPGPTVIARGLQKVELLAEGLRNLGKM